MEILEQGGKSILFVMAVEAEYGEHLRERFRPLITGVGPVEAAAVTGETLAHLVARDALPDLVVSLGSAGSRKLEQAEIYQAVSVSYRDMDASPLGFEKGVTPFLDLPAIIDLPLRIPGVETASLSTGANIVSGAAYDAIVVDAPPTGRISRFLDVTKALSDLAKGGPVHSQAEGVVRLLHSEETAIHLVTLLEALPIQETIEAIEELEQLDLPIGSVIVNRNIPPFLPAADLASAATGTVDADGVRAGLSRAGITLTDADFAGLLTETIEHATRVAARAESAAQLEDLHVPRLDLPSIADGVDLGSLYELAEVLAQQGVR